MLHTKIDLISPGRPYPSRTLVQNRGLKHHSFCFISAFYASLFRIDLRQKLTMPKTYLLLFPIAIIMLQKHKNRLSFKFQSCNESTDFKQSFWVFTVLLCMTPNRELYICCRNYHCRESAHTLTFPAAMMAKRRDPLASSLNLIATRRKEYKVCQKRIQSGPRRGVRGYR